MILLLGSSGYVGEAFLSYLKQKEIPCQGVSRAEAAYDTPQGLHRLLVESRPSFLINCAGYTGKPNVDACEIHKLDCLAGNATLPGVIDRVCRDLSLPWGHVSSGCIFTERREDGAGFTETDPPNFSFRQNNCSFYSGTKALGEELLGYQVVEVDGRMEWKALHEHSGYIWRLRIPFNHKHGPRNYLSKVMTYKRLLQAENSISHLNEFVSACWACWEKRVPYGIYNVTNPGEITTREVTEMILGAAKKNSAKHFPTEFNFFESEAEFMQVAAKTPRSNCVLDSSKLQSVGIKMTEVHEAIESALAEWES
jgi:dTDP-4-dehydrorhamnose reductase